LDDELDFAPVETEFYAQVILVVEDHKPLLGNTRLEKLAAATINRCAPDAPGSLWGCRILPDSIRLIVGLTDEDRLDQFVETLKTRISSVLLDTIRHMEDEESLDAVLRYNPVWGGIIYHVWQSGYHRQDYHTEYRLSNAVYEMLREEDS